MPWVAINPKRLSNYDFFSVVNFVLIGQATSLYSVVCFGGNDQDHLQDELFSDVEGILCQLPVPSRCQSSQLPVAKSECLAVDEEI